MQDKFLSNILGIHLKTKIMNPGNKKLKIVKRTLITYSKNTNGNHHNATDPTTSTITTSTVTGIFTIMGTF